jgi:hypothetical protein
VSERQKPLRWVWMDEEITPCPDLLPSVRSVAQQLARHMNDEGACHPSYARLATLAGVNERTAMRAVARLLKVGVLTREKGGGGRRSNTYRAAFPRSGRGDIRGDIRGDREVTGAVVGVPTVIRGDREVAEVSPRHPRGDTTPPEVFIEEEEESYDDSSSSSEALRSSSYEGETMTPPSSSLPVSESEEAEGAAGAPSPAGTHATTLRPGRADSHRR